MKIDFNRRFTWYEWAAIVLPIVTIWICFTLLFRTGNKQQYASLVLGIDNHSLLLVKDRPSSDLTVSEEPHARYRIFNIHDSHNRLTDHLWIKKSFWSSQGSVFDWNQYKYLPINIPESNLPATTGLVIHDRFLPAKPPMAWPEFSVSATRGEAPVESSVPVQNVKIIASYLVYLYDSSELLTASYGSDGTLIQNAYYSNRSAGYHHFELNPDSHDPLIDYQLPARFLYEDKLPPVNSVILSGLDHVKFKKYKKSKLAGCFIIGRAFDLKTICVRSFDADGTPVDEKVYEYRQRPWDEEVARSYWGKGSTDNTSRSDR
ncbi:hypothetical protein [Gimesia maris]|uniref:hypothetical protein n=1 Tax=Gimesia maris TaxID=122 RepID=UPI0030D715B7